MWSKVCDSSNISGHGRDQCHCHRAKLEGFLQPCLLLLLGEGSSYGYQLMETLTGLGWESGSPDPGVIYRNLRRMEGEGVVESSWDTSGAGPARRLYRLTPEGQELLHAWAVSIGNNVSLLESFLARYRNLFQNHKEEGDQA